jgi:hypothetical protein
MTCGLFFPIFPVLMLSECYQGCRGGEYNLLASPEKNFFNPIFLTMLFTDLSTGIHPLLTQIADLSTKYESFPPGWFCNSHSLCERILHLIFGETIKRLRCSRDGTFFDSSPKNRLFHRVSSIPHFVYRRCIYRSSDPFLKMAARRLFHGNGQSWIVNPCTPKFISELTRSNFASW